jgi:RNA polymerase subunit RPABC4/transcription elongation factor Spt4
MPKKLTKINQRDVDEEIKQRDMAGEEIIDKRFVLNSAKDKRACQFCKLILSTPQWKAIRGCPNCEKSQGLEHTTDKFTGLIALIYSKRSWLAKWTGNNHLITGAYAKQVLKSKHESYFDSDGEVSSEDGSMMYSEG